MTAETPPEMTPETPPEDVVAETPPEDVAAETPPEGVADATVAAVAVVDPEEEKKRRRRKALLLFLLLLLSALLLFVGWYLITRKPISEIPLPGVVTENLPRYEFSVYGVIAPTGVAVSPDGSRIYVTQTEKDPKVLILDRNGAELASVTPPETTGTDHVPVYVALNPTNGDLYVSDRPAGAIYIYSGDGIYRRTFDPGKDLKGWQPLGMAFNAKGNLFVTDVSGPFNTVHEFGPDETLIQTIGEAGQFDFPNGVAVDDQGYIYVTDSNNGRLVVFDAEGKQRQVIGRGNNPGELGLPRGTAAGDGRLYVVDTTGHGVQVYRLMTTPDQPPKYIGGFGIQGTDDGAFQFPNGVAVDGRARIYVTDWRNNRVQVWTY